MITEKSENVTEPCLADAQSSSIPPSLIGGEITTTVLDDQISPLVGVNPQSAIIDTLSFSLPDFIVNEKDRDGNYIFNVENEQPDEIVKRVLDLHLSKLGFEIKSEVPARNFYKWTWSFYDNAGFIAYGGNNNTVNINITGNGCILLTDYSELAKWMDSSFVKITRIDLAHDDFEGVRDIDFAIDKYKSGEFKKRRQPKAKLIDDFGSGEGKTFYVGNRDNGKLLRVYEKGKQLGDKVSNWVRWEVEFRSIDRVIPFDLIKNPGAYLAGSYPALNWISDDQHHIQTINKQVKLSYDKLIKHAQTSYGKLINMMHEIEDSPEKIISKLIKDGRPKSVESILELRASAINSKIVPSSQS